MKAAVKHQLNLRDGTTVELVPLDLDRFIRLKDLLTEWLERVYAEMGANPTLGAATPNVLLVRALKKVGREEVLDLLTILTDETERERLAQGFRPGILFEALKYLLESEDLDLRGLLGEAPSSPGPSNSANRA